MTTSVVIATYNGERFIEQQLESIINQSLLPDEIIISDDGSQDRTVEIVSQFIEKNQALPIRFISIKNNTNSRGVHSNFENAINKATGEYVLFCDQDDIWLDSKIEKCVSVLRTSGQRVLIHNARRLEEKEDGKFVLSDKQLMPQYPFDKNGLFRFDGKKELAGAFSRCIINGMCMCVEREWLLSILPFSRSLFHDQWVLFCGFSDDTVIATKAELALYRIHRHNVTNFGREQQSRSFGEKMRSFSEAGKRSITLYYTWYKDTVEYMGTKSIENDYLQKRIRFLTKDRITALKRGKLQGTGLLIREWIHGSYSTDGKIMFFHDLWFIWCSKKSTREEFIQNLDNNLRKNRLSISESLVTGL